MCISPVVSEDVVPAGAFTSEVLRTESRYAAQPEQLTIPGLHAIWSEAFPCSLHCGVYCLLLQCLGQLLQN